MPTEGLRSIFFNKKSSRLDKDFLNDIEKEHKR